MPLVARWPGRVPAGSTADDLVDAADLFPTFCGLTGVAVPEGAAPDGVSFAAPLLGRGRGKREWVTAGIGDNFIVFDGAWRLDHKTRTLVDCRALPAEKRADLSQPEAQAAARRVGAVLDELAEL